MFALSMGGHAVASRVDRVLVPGDACLRGMAFGYEPVKLKFGKEKVARRNLRSNLLTGLTLIHGRGMARHQAKGKKASTRPRVWRCLGVPIEGSCVNFQCCAAF